MNKWTTQVMVLGGLLALLGCGGDSGTSGGFGGSCTSSTTSICTEFTGSLYTAERGRSSCATTMGAYSAERCPAPNLVGECTIGSAATQTVLHYYAPTTKANATGFCTALSGTWQDPG